MQFEEDILLIAGPTASGKTGLAIAAARINNAVIINADSMQVYTDLRVVSARPTSDEESAAPHFLFGHVDGSEAYSVAQWLSDVKRIMVAEGLHRKKLILVGGTGLYFNGLVRGLSPVPDIDPAIRKKWREAGKFITSQALYRELHRLDPATAEVLRPSDRQRTIRALEVFESTGKSLREWHGEGGRPLFGEEQSIRKVLLMPERKDLHERINQRFDLMIGQGAVEEVKCLLKRNLASSLPVMKAIGVSHLREYIEERATLQNAVERAKAATRQYAKRQSTWFRNSFGGGWEQLTG